MVIQDLKPSRRVEGRWLAVLEDGSILRLGEGEVVDFALYAGKELSEGEAEALTQAARRSGLRLPDGTVELIHQRIHGRVHLTSVNMPEGDGDGGSVGFPASGEAQHKTGGQRRQQEDSFFHGYASSLKTGCLPSRSR